MTARFLCVGTHHKTGTVWMRRTFHKFAEAQGIPVVRMVSAASMANLPAQGPALVVNWSSDFPQALFDHPEARFLHMIRDPRDVLLSGWRYHLTAPTGNEKFLRTPRDDLGGLTYQEHLRKLDDPIAQILFEMAGKHDETVQEMRRWPYGHEHAIDLRFEAMIDDTDCALFSAAIDQMDVQGFDREGLRQSYWKHSLFGGLAAKDAITGHLTGHIKSGKSAQWRARLPREVAEVYAARYGDALRQLGYEGNDAWVAECRPASELAAELSPAA